MSGIFGIWCFDGRPMQLALLQQAASHLRHRGPDDEGYLLVNIRSKCVTQCGGKGTDSRLDLSILDQSSSEDFDLALAFRRLSILDLSPAGHQPMANSNERFWIVLNGEIYNYLGLRAELAGYGYEFHTRTDTEVVLAAYQQWGPDCLQRFNGMWALLIVDLDRGQLFASRDRFGIKPLYYWCDPGKMLAFASEIKAFSVLSGFRPVLNPQRAYDYLAQSLTDHTDETLFEGVYQLRGGERVLLPLDQPSTHRRLPVERWWDLPEEPITDITLEGAAGELKDLLMDSVRLRLRADVPVGSCLSGGIDSSSIVCTVNMLLKKENAEDLQHTVSSCFDIDQYDERRFIHEVVKATQTDAHYTFPGAEGLWQTLDSLIWHQDEPFESTSVYAQWEVLKLAATLGLKVMLDGQGADEQLAGYNTGYHGVHLASVLFSGQWNKVLQEMSAYRRVRGYSWPLSVLRLANVILPGSIRTPIRAAFGKPLVPRWLNRSRLETLGVIPGDPRLAETNAGTTLLKRFSRDQLTRTNLPRLLRWEDRNSMAHSVEARVPFLDYRLVSFVYNLPDEYKISGAISKCVLRRAMTGLVPDTVLQRVDKMGFVTPEQIWIKDTLREQFRHELERGMMDTNGLPKPAAVLSLYDKALNERNQSTATLWRIFNFCYWVQKFNVTVP